jgi:plastocyanin
MRALRVTAAFAVVLASLTMAGCGADDASTADPGSGPVTVKVEFKDGTVTPNGETVEVATGQEVTFEVSADEGGEMHVHSSPEQELAYETGDSTHTITIDTPGTVDVESHDLDQVIVQLHVS